MSNMYTFLVLFLYFKCKELERTSTLNTKWICNVPISEAPFKDPHIQSKQVGRNYIKY